MPSDEFPDRSEYTLFSKKNGNLWDVYLHISLFCLLNFGEFILLSGNWSFKIKKIGNSKLAQEKCPAGQESLKWQRKLLRKQKKNGEEGVL